jgi:AcrR family transcriptional regulator
MMNAPNDLQAAVRRPQQARSRQRFESIVEGAAALLEEQGLSGFSIPTLADRLGYIRASIYQYFPTPSILLNELMRRELVALQAQLGDYAAELRARPWRDTLRLVVEVASEFHNTHPVGRMLILGGPATDESHQAQALTIQHLGQLARQLLEQRGFKVPIDPDAAVLAVDLGTTCFRVSFHLHGEITPVYREEAVRIMTTYLSLYEPRAD